MTCGGGDGDGNGDGGGGGASVSIRFQLPLNYLGGAETPRLRLPDAAVCLLDNASRWPVGHRAGRPGC